MLNELQLSRRRVLVAGSALAATAVLAACGEADEEASGNGGNGSNGQSGPTPTPEPDPTPTDGESEPIFATDGEAAVISVEYEGGFLAVEDIVRRTPIISLFNDGQLVYPGPIPEIFPQPAAPNVLVTTLSEKGMQAVGERVLATGLFEDGDRELELEGPLVADAPTTVFTVRLAGQEPVRVSAYALNFGAGLPGEPVEESEERQKLVDLLNYLTSAPTGFPTDHIGAQETSYVLQRLEIITYPWSEIPYAFDAPPEPTPWPLDEGPLTIGEPFVLPGHDARCAVLEGEDLATMLDALNDANILTRWEHDGKFAALITRPLLPGQEGCASPFSEPGTPPASGDYSYPDGEDDLVLRYEMTGGFVPLEWYATRMPTLSVYGDGRVFYEGAQITIFPPPALPAIALDKVTPDGIQWILSQADAIGLLEGEQTWDELAQYVADASTGILTINANGETHRVSVYAPGMSDVGDMVSEEEAAFRALFDPFVAHLSQPFGWVPEEYFVDVEDGFPVDRLQLVAQPATAAASPEFEPNAIDWPLDTPLAEIGEPYTLLEMARCFVVEGDEFAIVMSLMSDATTLTRWISEGDEYVLYVRPLLPDEEGCRHPFE